MALFKRGYMGWLEYRKFITTRDHINFIDQTCRKSIANSKPK